MNPRVKEVIPNKNFTLNIIFENDEERIFDMKPYLATGVFKQLKEYSLFKTVRTFMGSVQWKNGQDLCPDTLYIESKTSTAKLKKRGRSYSGV